MRTSRWKFLASFKLIWPCDTLRYLVTLTFDLFDLGQWSYMAGQVVNPSTKFEDLRLSVLELWVLTSLIGYHWQYVCSHCACAVSRDLCAGANFPHIFEIPDPDLPLHYTTFMALRLRQMELSAKTMFGPVLKITQFSACAENHVNIERCRKSFTTIVHGDHDFQLIASIFGNLAAFRAIFSHIFTAHKTAIYELPVKILTSQFDSLTPISL